MKIKAIGFTSFEISNDKIVVVTDPVYPSEIGMRVKGVSADVAIFSQLKNAGKPNLSKGVVTPVNREKVFEVSGAGEYEIAELLIQRPIGMPYYILDYGYTRIVYVGLESKKCDVEMFKDLGDVEVLILPVGNGEMFPNYDQIADIINEVDPTTLVPCGYSTKKIKEDLGIKSKEDFLHHFGYSTYSEEKTLKVAGKIEDEETVMNIVFLEY